MMLLTYILTGLTAFGSLAVFVIWMIRQGKAIAKAEYLAEKVTALQIVNRKKNEYLNDLDKIVQKSEAYDKKITSAFDSGHVDNVVSIIRGLESETDTTKNAD